MIRYDRSPASVLVYCTTCGWRELAVTREGAWRVALNHETGVHPGHYQVRDAAAQRDRRREDDTR